MTDDPKAETGESTESVEEQPETASTLRGLMLQYMKWWLTPIVLVIVIVGFLVLMQGGEDAPFVYPMH